MQNQKKPSNYQNTVIYKINCKEESIVDFYIGHSTNFKLRTSLHKFYSKTNTNKLYEFIRANGGWDNFDIQVIENYPCISRGEAHKREREVIEELKPTLNGNLPLRSYKELREKNKDKYNTYMREYMKKYYQKTKEQAKQNEVKKEIIDTLYWD